MYIRSMLPRTLVATILLSLISITSGTAQTTRTRSEKAELRDKFQREVMQFLVDFWSPKLADYKQYIDRSLSPADLNTLTNLRVRWAIFMEAEKIRRAEMAEQMRNYHYEEDYEESYEATQQSVDSAMTAANQAVDSAMNEANRAIDSAAVMAYMAIEEANRAIDYPTNTEEEVEAVPDYGFDLGDESVTTDVAVAVPMECEMVAGEGETVTEHDCGGEVDVAEANDDDVYHHSINESQLIMNSAAAINESYRPMYAVLDKKVANDFIMFFDGLIGVRDRFVVAHASEIERHPSVARWLHDDDIDNADKRQGLIDELLNDEQKELHAIMALYNGGGLESLLGGMEGFSGITSSTSSVPAESGVVSGTATQLLQNNPNPAGTNTVISFRLAEPSNITRLRVYDATGQVMSDMNLGSRAAGSHETAINVSDFPAGNYVYHLTVQSSMGEEVYSKVMRVVR